MFLVVNMGTYRTATKWPPTSASCIRTLDEWTPRQSEGLWASHWPVVAKISIFPVHTLHTTLHIRLPEGKCWVKYSRWPRCDPVRLLSPGGPQSETIKLALSSTFPVCLSVCLSVCLRETETVWSHCWQTMKTPDTVVINFPGFSILNLWYLSFLPRFSRARTWCWYGFKNLYDKPRVWERNKNTPPQSFLNLDQQKYNKQ